jgi:hypothetical protein
MYKKTKIDPPHPLTSVYRLSFSELCRCKKLGLCNILLEAVPDVYVFISEKNGNILISADNKVQNSRTMLTHAKIFVNHVREQEL